MTQQDIVNENIIKQLEIRVQQDEEKINALENVIIKMGQFVPIDERELFLHTLSSEELERLEVAEIVAMIKTKQPGIVVSNGITSTEDPFGK
jgi:hypothetical protein